MLTCLSKTANNSAVPFGIFIDTAVEEKKEKIKWVWKLLGTVPSTWVIVWGVNLGEVVYFPFKFLELYGTCFLQLTFLFILPRTMYVLKKNNVT